MYTSTPTTPRSLGATPIRSIEFHSYVNPTGVIDMPADDIRLVPEPTTLSLLAMGDLTLIRQRRT